MKKLLKSEICGSMNNDRCTIHGRLSQKLRLLFMNSSRCWGKCVPKKKEGEKRKKLNAGKRNVFPNPTLV